MSWSGIGWTAAVLTVVVGTVQQDTGPANRALVDVDATEEVRAAATSLSEDLFSFSHTDVKGHEATFARLTTGDFSREYGKLFNDVVQQVQARQLTMTSTVADSAVRVLRGDRAEVLVFLDQRSSGAGQRTDSAATYTATLQRVDGDWKFAGIDLFEDR